MKNFPLFSLRLCAFAVIVSGCAPKNENRVVLYCSVDEVYAKPLIKQLEVQTGLKIDALFDTEATKTAGLANRIRAESNRPRADVFWSSALLQTLLMSDEKLLQPNNSPSARDLPARFVGKDWVGVGARAHILVTSTRWNNVSSAHQNSFQGVGATDANTGQHSLGMSNPQFGTASDWATAYGARWGEKAALQYFQTLQQRKVRIFPGNGDVARAVAEDGEPNYGITDSDDFLAQKREKTPAYIVRTSADNVLVPGAASILQGAPHLANAQKLLDAIASAQNERALIRQMPGVFSLRHLNEKSNFQSGGVDFSFLQSAPRDDYSRWPRIWRGIREPLNQIFASK